MGRVRLNHAAARVNRWRYRLLLLVALGFVAFALALQSPFAFYSPDGSFHAAKLLRAAEGDCPTDPFSGTPSLYPALFHCTWGTLNRLIDLDSAALVRFVGLVQFLGLFAAFFVLTKALVPDGETAAQGTLALALLFYAPTGRHILVANPANFGLPFAFLGAGLLWRHLATGGLASLVLGMLALGVAANAAWYLAIPVAALLAALLWSEERRWPPGSAALAALAALAVPCVFTAWQLYAIRGALPDYSTFTTAEAQRHGAGLPGPSLLVDWLRVLVTKGNDRFEGALRRSWIAGLEYYGLVLPFSLGLLAASIGCFVRLRTSAEPAARRLRGLALGAALTFVLSLLFSVTRDFPRVSVVQFAGWALLVPFVLGALSRLGKEHLLRGLGPVSSAAALVALGYTALHGGEPLAAEPSPYTRAVVRFIGGVPGHRDVRIFVSEAHLRELSPFVTFRSFVNHGDGRYYAQDPVSSTRMRAAYDSILERRPDWRDAMAAYGVRYLVFRQAGAGPEREAALFYLGQGRAVLANPEWWVIELPAAMR